MKYVYIVDSKLVAYYLIQRGRSISEIFSKIGHMLKYLKKRGEVYICFDVGHSDFRLKEQSYYKGHRRIQMAKNSVAEQLAHEKFNEDYLKLIPLFEALNVKVAGADGVEADDLASLICEKYKDDPEAKVTLFTGDYDYVHMIIDNENIRIFDFPKWEMMYAVDARLKYNLKTRREFSVYKALVGDRSDNIKCIRNIADVHGREVFDSIYEEFDDDPTDEQIIMCLTDMVDSKDKYSVHKFHLDDGRTTPGEAFLSNMKIADPFTDVKQLTAKQRKVFLKTMKEPFKTEAVSTEVFTEMTIAVFGYPVILDDTCKKIYGMKS